MNHRQRTLDLAVITAGSAVLVSVALVYALINAPAPAATGNHTATTTVTSCPQTPGR